MKPKKITFAEQDKIEQYSREVDAILDLIGHPEAFVTDLSTVFDFMPAYDDNGDIADEYKNVMILARLTSTVGREVLGSDYIWQLAKELHQEW